MQGAAPARVHRLAQRLSSRTLHKPHDGTTSSREPSLAQHVAGTQRRRSRRRGVLRARSALAQELHDLRLRHRGDFRGAALEELAVELLRLQPFLLVEERCSRGYEGAR